MGTVTPYEGIVQHLSCNVSHRRVLPTFCPHFRLHQTRKHPPRSPDSRGFHHGRLPGCGTAENHDFFSGSGSSYVIGKAEATEDDDWDF